MLKYRFINLYYSLRYLERRKLWLLICLLSLSVGICVYWIYLSSLSTLDRIHRRGELIVVTRNSPTTYYTGPEGPTGFEYDLAKAFAEQLGVQLKIVVPNSFSNIIPMIEHRDADIAAAGLTITEKRQQVVSFSQPYQEVFQQIVYHRQSTPPRKVEDLIGKEIAIVANSSHAERLRYLKQEYPELTWTEYDDVESEELLYRVWRKELDFTVADSNELEVARRTYPDLEAGFNITQAQRLAWAMHKGSDDSLLKAVEDFFTHIRNNGILTQLQERHYGHVGRFNYVGTRIFMSHIAKRLPTYQLWFQQAAQQHDLDWRLLAAMGYQESQWDPLAVSPTGVRGLMMLTQATAGQLDIQNRLDPRQSIFGGAFYLSDLKSRLPKDIEDPDRIWMALAAYNVGIGHVMDARIITRKTKGDPNKWVDLKDSLPLLSHSKWYQQLKYGYARGREPVQYVQNIRRYYDILVWITEKDKSQAPSQTDVFSILPEPL